MTPSEQERQEFNKAAEIEAQTPITVGGNQRGEGGKVPSTIACGDGKPEGTKESLKRCADMLNTYAPELFPANEQGQVDFARAMMESVADEILAFLSTPADAPPLPEGTVPPFRWASSGLSSHVIDSSEKPNWFCDDTKYMCECVAYALNTVYGKEKRT